MVIVYPRPCFECVYLRLYINPKIIKFGTAKLINFPEGSGNIISSHKRLWKCHSHYNKSFFIYFIQIYFICFVENLRTYLRKIYGHVPPLNGYFCIKKSPISMGTHIYCLPAPNWTLKFTLNNKTVLNLTEMILDSKT